MKTLLSLFMKKVTSPGGRISLAILLMVFISSCVPTKQLSYFNDIDELEKPVVNPKTQKTILPFDRLYIRILSTDPQTRLIFDFPDEVRYSSSSNSMVGYLVDESGNIDFPFVGKINVGFLSTFDAAQKIQTSLNDYVSNTSIVVKYIDTGRTESVQFAKKPINSLNFRPARKAIFCGYEYPVTGCEFHATFSCSTWRIIDGHYGSNPLAAPAVHGAEIGNCT